MEKRTIVDSDVETIVRCRREIRVFSPDPIPDDILLRILNAGRYAPSSKNSQPWHFIVVRNRTVLEELSKTTYTGRFLAIAPLAIAVVLENAKLESDSGRVVQNMLLVAWKYGISGVWITNFWDKAKEILGIPMTSNFKLATIIPLGFIPEHAKPKGKKIRKDLSEIVHMERFGTYFLATR